MDKPKTLEDAWSQYLQACYSGGIRGTQLRETRQAFFSGAFVLLGLIGDLPVQTEDEACHELQLLYNECERVKAESIRANLESYREGGAD